MNAIRGAIFVDVNTREDILAKTEMVLTSIILKNHLDIEDIISITFAATNDLTKVYPAIAARDIGIVDAALFCTQEMYVENSSRMCVRVMMHVNTNYRQSQMQHVYMNGAEKLRPDLQKPQEVFSIAIDGPSGAGKSTIAKKLASHFNSIYIDTGAMYRTVGLYCVRQGISLDDTEAITTVVNHLDITIEHIDGEQHVVLNGEDVNHLIRTPQMSEAASKVSVVTAVRQKLVELQRAMAKTTSVVMDGRDIGTHVLKDATVKIYLEASVEVRAERRYNERVNRGEVVNIEAIKKDIAERDYRDMNREVSPLEQAEDAVLVDTSHMTIEQVVATIIEIYGEKNGNHRC